MMEMKLKQAKLAIRNYFQTAYSDDALAELLDYARAGKLRFYSCCCIAGFPLRPSGLKPLELDEPMNFHRSGFHSLGLSENPSVEFVSNAFHRLGDDDDVRCRRIIPMIKAEIRRRTRNETMSPDPHVFRAHH